MSRVTPKLALVLGIFLFIVNVVFIVAGIHVIRTGGFAGIGLVWFLLVFTLDFIVLTLFNQLQTSDYSRVP